MNDLWVALGLVLVIEGLLYAAFPGAVRRMMEMAQTMPEAMLRGGGLVALLTGLLVVWLARA